MVMQDSNLEVLPLTTHASKSYKLIKFPFPVQNIIYIKNTGTTSEESQITSLQTSQSPFSSAKLVLLSLSKNSLHSSIVLSGTFKKVCQTEKKVIN